MKTLKIVIWSLVKNLKTNEVEKREIYYIYQVRKEILQKLLSTNYYKKNPFFMPLDRTYKNEFKLIKTNENIKNIKDYEVIDTDSQTVSIDGRIIYCNKEN